MNDKICLILVVVGAVMILLGTWMTYRDWSRKGLERPPRTEAESFEGSLKALTELLKVLRGYPPGMWLIVLGVVLLIIAGLFCGLAGFGSNVANSVKS